jgi:hypothetical protein
MTARLETFSEPAGAGIRLADRGVDPDLNPRIWPETARAFGHQIRAKSGLPGHVDSRRRPGEIERNRNRSGRLRRWEALC